jgi:hypothetical protein
MRSGVSEVGPTDPAHQHTWLVMGHQPREHRSRLVRVASRLNAPSASTVSAPPSTAICDSTTASSWRNLVVAHRRKKRYSRRSPLGYLNERRKAKVLFVAHGGNAKIPGKVRAVVLEVARGFVDDRVFDKRLQVREAERTNAPNPQPPAR